MLCWKKTHMSVSNHWHLFFCKRQRDDGHGAIRGDILYNPHTFIWKERTGESPEIATVLVFVFIQCVSHLSTEIDAVLIVYWENIHAKSLAFHSIVTKVWYLYPIFPQKYLFASHLHSSFVLCVCFSSCIDILKHQKTYGIQKYFLVFLYGVEDQRFRILEVGKGGCTFSCFCGEVIVVVNVWKILHTLTSFNKKILWIHLGLKQFKCNDQSFIIPLHNIFVFIFYRLSTKV